VITNLRPYPAYKDSGVPWLGKVPEEWQVQRNKLILTEVDDRSEDGTEELLTVSQYTGVTKRRDTLADDALVTNAASLNGYKRVSPGDLAMNIMLAWNGSLGVSSISGIVSPAYCVFRAKTDTNPRFLHYLFRTSLFTGVFKTVSTGVVDSRLRLYPDVFFRQPSLLPPIKEQATIVRYLDYMDRRIRKYMRAKQQLIALLNEQKQAIIQRAVTRGLDPNVRLKPSGVPWLGDIPEHWEALRLKDVTTPIEQGWSPQCDAQPASSDEWAVLKVGCVNRDVFDERENKRLPSTLEPIPALEIQDGDILVSRANTRELVGLAALAVNPRSKLMLCDKLFRFRATSGRADPLFLVSAIRQPTSRFQIESATNGASDSMQNIGQGVVQNLLLSLPPIREQEQVVADINARTLSLTIETSHAHHQIDLLREYRTRLIADVVTGKLDVRAAAATLPDEPEEEPEPIDETPTDEVHADEEAEEVTDGDQTNRDSVVAFSATTASHGKTCVEGGTAQLPRNPRSFSSREGKLDQGQLTRNP
jgi:type I restriction enzyme S subunit